MPVPTWRAYKGNPPLWESNSKNKGRPPLPQKANHFDHFARFCHSPLAFGAHCRLEVCPANFGTCGHFLAGSDEARSVVVTA